MAAGESTMPLVLVNQPIVGLLFKRTGFYSDLVYYLNVRGDSKGVHQIKCAVRNEVCRAVDIHKERIYREQGGWIRYGSGCSVPVLLKKLNKD